MAVFKCKMCGGDLEIIDGTTVAECEYCGTKQTVPTASDENLQALFNRANALRLKSEFDKAEKLYEKIIENEPTQSDAYWGLILCKYGIEYVDDPVTYKKVPTCHRTSFDSIIADSDYKAALEHADSSQRILYEQQAKEIDRIQKEILALSQKEERYDVFICYKETDSNGRRTQDSVIANDIYYQLTSEGFKVFYAAITLEGKLGSAYEPIIFAALNSAKVMLAIGTKPEYFNAVWVKNEWSRFLKILKTDRSKLLIPCYRDMDAYELPEEFAHLQAQDMSKIGFINDVVRGIKKVIRSSAAPKAQPIRETVIAQAPSSPAALFKRGLLSLEDGDFERADEFSEQILNQNPECAEAYVIKLMIDVKANNKTELANSELSIENNKNYQKAIRFANKELGDDLKNIAATINARIAKKIEDELKEKVYSDATVIYYKSTHSPSYIPALESAIEDFNSILDYKDSSEFIEKCKQEIDSIKTIANEQVYYNATSIYKNSSHAVSYIPKLESAISSFKSLSGYRDSEAYIDRCTQEINSIRATAAKRKAEAERARIEEERKRAIRRKRAKKIALIAIPSVLLIITCIILYVTLIKKPKVDGIQYEKISGGYRLVEYVGDDSEVVIPDEVRGKPVIEIGEDAFSFCDSLTNVTIPDSVTKIGNGAFYKCTSLTSVTIPDSVTSIGYSAFDYCTSLTSVTIPDSVTTIGGCAFKGCSALMSVTIPESITHIGEGAFAGCDSIAHVYITDLTAWCNISDVQNLTEHGASKKYLYIDDVLTDELVIPDSITHIGDYTFAGFTNITEVTFHDNVTAIGNYTFYGCKGIESVTIPNSVRRIGSSAFSGCSSLEDVTVGARVESIGIHAFSGCPIESANIPTLAIPYVNNSKLKTVFIHTGSRIDASAFSGCTSLTSVTIPESVTEIGDWAFSDCSKLASVTIPESVTSIGKSAFRYCTGLTDLNIPDSVRSIGESAFLDCSSLKSVTIGAHIESIGNYAFIGCPIETANIPALAIPYVNNGSLKNVVIHSGSSIGNSAFEDCVSLESVIIPSSIISIGNSAFKNCNRLESITIPQSLNSIGDYAFSDCSALKSITIPISVTSIGNHTFDGCRSFTNITIPATVSTIGSYAFANCSDLSSVTIPASVNSIGDHAFYYCTVLTNATVSIGVESIGGYAFAGCSNLTSVSIPQSLNSIGEYAFAWCEKLGAITIPVGVTSIGDFAFKGCIGFTAVTLPDSLESIGAGSFSGCSNIESLTIPFVGGSKKSSTDTYQHPLGYIFGTSNYIGATATGQSYYGANINSATYMTYYIPAKLTSVTVTGGNILYGAFSYCRNLTSVTVGDAVKSVGFFAFYGCSALKSATIGDGVEIIGLGAFSGCSSLESLTIPFVGGSRKSEGDTYQYPLGYIFGTSSYSTGISTTQYYYGQSTENTTYSIYYIPATLSSVTVTGGNILYGAFYGCGSIDSVTLPNGIEKIGDFAFYQCADLDSITIPDSVKSIGRYAFYYSQTLESVTLGSAVTSISECAFMNCERLATVINKSKLTLSKGTTSNGYVAYYATTITKQ